MEDWIKKYDKEKIAELEETATNELKGVLKDEYPFIPFEAVQDIIIKFVTSYTLNIEADKNKMSQYFRDADKDWKLLASINPSEVIDITFALKTEKAKHIKSVVVINQLFMSLQNLIKAY